MNNEEYVKYLEGFKRYETQKRYYRTVVGMSPSLAEAAAGADLNNNTDLLKKCFEAFKKEGARAEIPEMRQKSKEEEMEEAFLKGFNKSLW